MGLHLCTNVCRFLFGCLGCLLCGVLEVVLFGGYECFVGLGLCPL